jgi:hypothetical protein
MIIEKEACTCGGYMTPYLQDVSTMFSQEIYLYWRCHFCEYLQNYPTAKKTMQRKIMSFNPADYASVDERLPLILERLRTRSHHYRNRCR